MKNKNNFDFTGYRHSVLKRRINKRLSVTNTNSFEEYYKFLIKNSSEIDALIDTLTINVSRFFRNPLVFDFISEKLIPPMIFEKIQTDEKYLRIWSAGCACGEEPYSLAIIFNEFLEKESIDLVLNIFATDINKTSLKCAEEGLYNFESIKEVKYGLFKKYFKEKRDLFKIISLIKGMVSFSFYNLIEKRSYVPPESIYGNFDLIFCRNVLIYFNLEHQNGIFEKLYRALAPKGYLVLGESEIVPNKYKKHFKRVSKFYKIFCK